MKIDILKIFIYTYLLRKSLKLPIQEHIMSEKNELPENPLDFKEGHAKCFICGKEVDKVLALKYTNADICSFECEKRFRLYLTYG